MAGQVQLGASDLPVTRMITPSETALSAFETKQPQSLVGHVRLEKLRKGPSISVSYGHLVCVRVCVCVCVCVCEQNVVQHSLSKMIPNCEGRVPVEYLERT